MKPAPSCAACFALFLGLFPTGSAGDWTRFRGPNGSGISEDADPLPSQWSPTENLLWKTPLPGPGSSSPIVVGSRLFVTCWTGYGTDRSGPGRQEDLRRHLLCLDRENGTILWSHAIEPALPEDRYGGMFAQHGFASHTPVSDGERVYVYFGKTGALAFDLEGNRLWQTPVGNESDRRGWGSAASPVLYGNLLIVTASAESEALVALNKRSGEEVWRREARGFGSTWGTPVLVQVSEERTDLVLGVPNEIWGFSPETGTLLWHCEGLRDDSFCSSVVAREGIVYAVEGRGAGGMAVRVGGSGDVTQTHILWRGRDSSRISTPIVHDDRLYSISGRILTCIDSSTGERIYQTRLTGPSARGASPADRGGAPGLGGSGRGGFSRREGGGGGGGQDYSSPVLADGKLFFTARSGETYILKPGAEYELLSVSRVTEDEEDFSATPAVSNGQLFLRSNKFLYCVSGSSARSGE